MDEFTMEDAEDFYAQMHASGEMSDEEMENVSGGGCTVKVNGKKYSVVSSGTKCFTGKYVDYYGGIPNRKTDHAGLRSSWASFCLSGAYCGSCNQLDFTSALTGYCSVEFD